jgi:integrase
MSVKVRERRGVLYLDVYQNGQRHRESLQLASLAYGLNDPIGGKQTLYQWLEKLGEGRDRKKDRVVKCLPCLTAYPGGKAIHLEQVNPQWIENFQNWLLNDSGLGQTSAASYAAAIRLALRRAERNQMIPHDPAKAVKSIPAKEADKVHLTAEEAGLLARTPLNGETGGEVKKAFLFACFTGLRVSDIKTLAWGDIETSPLQIKKRQHKTRNIVYIPLHETAWGIINDNALHNHAGPVFPRLARCSTNLSGYLETWRKAAGLEKRVGWHTARHTFAVLSLEGGADLYTVSKLLGHTNLQTTQVYARATDKMKRAAVDALSAIDMGTVIENGKTNN